jgi:hypothetical protein
MSNLNISVPHQLSQDEALNRIRQAVAQAKEQYSDRITDFQETWNGYSGTFNVSAMGFSVPGSVSVNPSDVNLQASLPLFAAAFKGTMESFVRDHLTNLLA